MRHALAAVIFLLALTGCGTTPRRDFTPVIARFFLESTDAQSGFATLPQSGVRIAVAVKPVITEFDFVNVQVARVELGQCLMFQLTPAAARDLYRLTTTNQGRRLVLVLNGEPVGSRRIERPFEDGTVLVFVEKPDAALQAIAEALRKTSEELQRAAAKKS